ncbi:SDR family oxidoreductase [Solwaraspora sp. WMMD791]|uniref:SDR family NAD(P)-dependent oxidoreductase n=1 Tax=Solwaraspora sp. WMMD791 TaxID=3016086 RepID=UPI00249B34B8|nr:SDR family oxidoreductase [Solwaraspora sp. WMMD791]WFE29962.1 SDR family oxidoreductase [Solwaraspora sp. WMMD791]
MPPVDYRDQTTLITGASSGIGAEFARQFAARGSDLVLVARREERLHRLATELTAAHRVRVEVLPADLSLPGAGERLAEQTNSRGITVTSVVNNAAFGTAGPFHREDPDRLRDEIAVNVTAVVDISRAFIGQLHTAANGVLINVASLAGYQPSPNLAVYAATKAFVLHFTEALWYESQGTGLRVLALTPGVVQTEFFEVLGTDEVNGPLPAQTASEVVATALRALGRRNGPPSVVSGRLNRLAAHGARLLNRRQAVQMMGRINARYDTATTDSASNTAA